MTKIEIDSSIKPPKGVKELTVLSNSISSDGIVYWVMLVDTDGQMWNGDVLIDKANGLVEWKSLINVTPKFE